MSLRQLCRQTSKPASKAMFLFPEEEKTGIAPTRLIVEKDLDFVEGQSVHVNWGGKKVQAEILALSDNENVLAEKDLEWCRKNFPKALQVEVQEASEPPREKVPANKSAESEASDHPYEQFLASHKKRELELRTVRESKRAKEARSLAPMMVTSSETPSTKDDVVAVLRQELAVKTQECRHLMNRLDAMEEATTKILSCQMQMQESFIKMMEKIQTSVSETEDRLLRKMTVLEDNLSNFEAGLGSLEGQSQNNYSLLDVTINNQCDEVPPLDVPIEPFGDDVTTIDKDLLVSLCEEPADIPVGQAGTSSVSEVGEELIGKCVTSRKVKTVQQTLGSENERHLCALKLLPSFFTTEELATSNTDGTYGKKCLDVAKLNSLKVLVFTKFPPKSNEEKEKLWRFIKSKINSKCRAIRKFYTAKDSPDRSS